MDIIYNGVYGSHLYGLSTPTSDRDYKGVYAPTKRELVFNKYQDSIEKQTPEVDETYYAVTKFLRILSKNDTVSMDMLFSNKEAAITTTPLWDKLQSYRQDLLCKNMRGLIGYVKTMSCKYGHKVQRYEEMLTLQMIIQRSLLCEEKVRDTTLPEIVMRQDFKFINVNIGSTQGVEDNIDICGSRYQLNAQVKYMKQGLDKKISGYGDRTKTGMMKGGDFKSLSHAYRVLVQMEELIDTRDLLFPLVKAEDILKVKLGEVQTESVISMIDDKFDIVMEKLEQSDLP